MNLSPHCNDTSRPLIFLGSSMNISKLADVCQLTGIKIAGIIDNDYWGNTDSISGIPVIDSESCFDDPERLAYYRSNYNFFCATNWSPETDPVTTRNREKRSRLIDIIDQLNLPCVSLVDPLSRVASTARIGRDVYIDAFALVESHCEIHDHATVFAFVGVGHHTHLMRNSVLQRHCSIGGEMTFEPDVFIGIGVRALKTGAKFGRGTFVHESVYIRRGTIPNEVVKQGGDNMSRVTVS